MAKFEIIDSAAKVATSTTPRTSTLALPMSLANTVGSGFTAVGKAIADIQKDIYALEDQNQVHEVLPEVNLKIQKEYDKYLKSIDVNAPQKFLKETSKDKFLELSKMYEDNTRQTIHETITIRDKDWSIITMNKLNDVMNQSNIDKFKLENETIK